MKYHLSLSNDFAPFLDNTFIWGKGSVTNHGFNNDPDTVEANIRKTAVQKYIQLDRMLGIIAQFSSSLLHSEITKRSTSLNWIWQRIKKHYSFSKSEVNFLKLYSIKRKEGERYETFYQRIITHLEDNLLTVQSNLKHDGEIATSDKEMSPTTERLAVYLWLTLIDERLPAYVSHVYAHDLQSQTLKDIQPQLAVAMDQLLLELNAQEDIDVNYSRASYKYRPTTNRNSYNSNKKSTFSNSRDVHKIAIQTVHLQKFVGFVKQLVNLIRDTLQNCWFISNFDKMEIAKAFLIEVDQVEDGDYEVQQEQQIQTIINNNQGVLRVQSCSSPYFHAFYQHHPCKLLIDTGATLSLVSKAFIKLAGISIKPTNHFARQVDCSSLKFEGEIHIELHFGDMILHIDALVMETLDCNILVGVPFCKDNDVEVHLKKDEISIRGTRYQLIILYMPQSHSFYVTI